MAKLPGSEIANILSALVALVVLGAYVCIFHFGVQPFERQFFCNDESISYPYKPDTVTMVVAAAVGCIIILIAVVVIEIIRHALGKHRSNLSDRDYASAFCCCCPSDSRPALATVAIARILLIAALGALVNEVVTVTLKTIIGRHRPHFLAICRANVTLPAFDIPCKAHLPIAPQDVCRPESAKLFKESMLSFPSGHSSHSMYMTVFASLYLQSRFTFAKGHAVKWFLQCLILAWGIAVCASRISDYKHHWSDVLGGGIIGVVVGLIVCLYFRPSYVLSCVGSVAVDDNAAASSAAIDNNNGRRGRSDGRGDGRDVEVQSPQLSNLNELRRLNANEYE